MNKRFFNKFGQLDTLKLVKALQEAGYTEKQAEVFTKLYSELHATILKAIETQNQ